MLGLLTTILGGGGGINRLKAKTQSQFEIEIELTGTELGNKIIPAMLSKAKL